MFTQEEFEYLRDYLDLRKSEVEEMKIYLSEFPKTIEFSELDLENILDAWDSCNHEYPVGAIICDFCVESLVRDFLEDKVESGYTVVWDASSKEIVFYDLYLLDGVDIEEITAGLDEILKEFIYYID
jgi:hypothetical protein